MNMGMGVTLREGDREYFYQALDRHFPGLKQKYQRTYGNAYEIMSPNHDRLTALFETACREAGILYRVEDVFAYLNEFPEEREYRQLSLFD